MRNRKHRRNPRDTAMIESAAEARHLEPGDIVVMTGMIELEHDRHLGNNGHRRFLVKGHTWQSQQETFMATYMGQTRTVLLGLPYDLMPEKLRGGMGQGRMSRTLVIVHTFMTDKGDVVIADPTMCERAI